MIKNPGSNSLETFRLTQQFDQLRQTLLQPERQALWTRPVGDWAQPRDRRLPVPLLHRSLWEVLHTTFQELQATPGVGLKKLGTLLTLLDRASSRNGAVAAPPHRAEEAPKKVVPQPFDPRAVSESLWQEWQGMIRRHGLEQIKLGSVAPSLRDLPSVVWDTPLSEFLETTLKALRERKAYGEKRVNGVVGTLHALHDLLGANPPDALRARIVPRLIAESEGWICAALAQPALPSDGELRQYVVQPLLEQLELDLDPLYARLVADRLGLSGESLSVAQLARKLRITRARIYQLIHECCRVAVLRWPLGRCFVTALLAKATAAETGSKPEPLLPALLELLFQPDDANLSEVPA